MQQFASLILALFLSGCIQAETQELATAPPIENPTLIEPEPSIGPIFTAHVGWIESNQNISATLSQGDTHSELQELDGKFGWYFLDPNTPYEIKYNNAAIEISTLQAGFSSPGEAEIFPGSWLNFADGGTCSSNVILRNPTMNSIYLVTAGHCTDFIGSWAVANTDIDPDPLIGWTIGMEFTSASQGWNSSYSRQADWAIIEVLPEAWEWISPDSPIFGGLNKQNINFEPQENDLVCVSGVSAFTTVLGEPVRCGEYRGHRNTTGREEFTGLYMHYRAHSEAGDSGGIVFHYETGIPLAIHTNASPFQPAWGFNLCAAITQAELVLAPLEVLSLSPYQKPSYLEIQDVPNYAMIMEPFQGKRDCSYEWTSNVVKWDLNKPPVPAEYQ